MGVGFSNTLWIDTSTDEQKSRKGEWKSSMPGATNSSGNPRRSVGRKGVFKRERERIDMCIVI